MIVATGAAGERLAQPGSESSRHRIRRGESVTPQHNRQRQGWLIALIALIGVVGLLAGASTRLFVSATSNQTLRQSPEPTATATLASEVSPTVASDPTTPPDMANFTLKVTASPLSGHAGDTITVSVLATDDATGAPAPGLTCHLRTPTDGTPGLLVTWPTPTATDASGVASWTVTIPANAPGRYAIEAFAQTPSWTYVARTSVTVTAS
jgi:hypothetical protein